MCASVVAKLQGSGVSTNVILSVVESMEECLNDIHTSIKHQILKVVPECNPSRRAVEDVLTNLQNPFSELNTDSKWKKYFYTKWGVVQPVEVHLGVRYDSKKNKVSGNYEQVPVNDTFISIPLFKTLDFIFKNEVIRSHIPSSTFSDLYSDFCDGSYFKTNQLYSKTEHALQIQVYYDDFETANPLGSKQGVHKLGCLYFTLRNLPPHLNSSLMNIHLISLFHSQDAKKYGLDKILTPFLDDVKKLEVHGMKVSFSEEPLYGTISQITGDNLGLNGILGYVESFSATYYCRLCLTDKHTAQTVFSEHDPRVVLRSRELNEQHYKSLENSGDGSCYGIKHNSILNDLKYFNVADNVVVDIMHDLLEGDASIDEWNQAFSSTISAAASSAIPKKGKAPQKKVVPWWNEECDEFDFKLHEDKHNEDAEFSSDSSMEYIQLNWDSSVQIYTDGSKDPESGKTGCAFFIPQSNSWVSISTYGELQNCELQLSSHQHPQDEGHTLTDAATQHHSL
ncbi:uncharacterized protein LOC125295613 [Alosa alosa]|uniref:uncharacterized protein LOC125295613 n=1 Tax=Alosa alosa TaxID=278164 RepID=UPI0020150FA4|nr:uncharacterized protein LOC125295613 [Alosa alosa]